MMSHKIKLETMQYQLIREALIYYANELSNGNAEPNLFKDADTERRFVNRMINKEFVPLDDTQDTETDDDS